MSPGRGPGGPAGPSETGLRVLQPAGWPTPKGYANGMVGRGRTIFVAGMVGWNEAGAFEKGFVAQTRRALGNILAVLAEAQAGPEHIARLTWYVTDLELYRAGLAELGPAYRVLMGRHFPAMAVVQVSGLVEREALVEIEATALVPD